MKIQFLLTWIASLYFTYYIKSASNKWNVSVEFAIIMNSLILLKISLILFVCDQAACAESPMCKTIICPKNEVFSQSANTCQPTCFGDEFKNNSLGCTEGKGCVCKEGFIRDPRTFNCIAKKSCPKKASDTTCPTNEVYSKDGAGCQLSCSTQNIAIKCMTRSGCKCRDGFIRDDITGQCISKRSCSSKLTFCM